MDEEHVSEADASRLPSEQQRSMRPLPRYDWQLLAVRLHDVHVERLEEQRPPAESAQHVELQAETQVAIVEEGLLGRLTVDTALPSQETPECRIRLTFEGSFAPRDSSVVVPPAEEIDVRYSATVLTLLWPYAREFMHDLVRRMEVEARPLPTVDSLAILEQTPRVDSRSGVHDLEVK